MGWGGIIAQGLIGAGVGMAEQGLSNIEAQKKADAEKMREERLSQLRIQEHKANAQSSADIALAQIPKTAQATSAAEADPTVLANRGKVEQQKVDIENKSRAEAAAAQKRQEEADKQQNMKTPGFRYEHNGSMFEVGPDMKPVMIASGKSQEEIDNLKAQAKAHNAAAAASYATAAAKSEESRSAAAAAKEAAKRPTDPKETPIKDESGVTIGVKDAHTGWKQVNTAGEEAVPAKTGFLGMGAKEAVPAKEGTTVWKNPQTGEVLDDSAYRAKFYTKGLANSPPPVAGAAPAAKTAAPVAAPAAEAPAPKFVTGKVYENKQTGKKAKWNGTTMEPI